MTFWLMRLELGDRVAYHLTFENGGTASMRSAELWRRWCWV